MKPAIRRGTYDTKSRRLVRIARAFDAAARRGECAPPTCWRCGRTLAEHPAHKTGKPADWTAGHVDRDHPTPWLIPLVIVIDGRWVAPEVSTCNYEQGARHGNRLRSQAQYRTSRRW